MLCVHVGQRKEGDMEWKGNEKNRKVAWRKWVVGNYTPQQYVPGICRHTYALGISEKRQIHGAGQLLSRFADVLCPSCLVACDVRLVISIDLLL